MANATDPGIGMTWTEVPEPAGWDSGTDGRFKYIHHRIREDESELYDLTQDPRELNNLYTDRPADLERLCSLGYLK